MNATRRDHHPALRHLLPEGPEGKGLSLVTLFTVLDASGFRPRLQHKSGHDTVSTQPLTTITEKHNVPASLCSLRLDPADDGCLHPDGLLTNGYTTSRDSDGTAGNDVARNRGCGRRRREDSSPVSGRSVLAEAASEQ